MALQPKSVRFEHKALDHLLLLSTFLWIESEFM